MRIKDKNFPVSAGPYLIGILNITPDSFHAGSRTPELDQALAQAQKLFSDGADILDIGGESTRPGSDPMDESIELARVIPVVRALGKRISAPLSIDTCKSKVAEQAIKEGAAMLNDITALSHDPAMADLARAAKVPVVLMHMQGDPKTMQENPSYDDPVREVGDFLLARAAFAEKKGILPENIILDPGIGFGKRTEDNLALIRGFADYIRGRYPVLIGHSRKRFIGTLISRPDTGDRLFGSLGAAAAAVRHGAAFLRVHDVRETREMLTVALAVEGKAA
jgi:dihydropteroate synthase